jgi:hypothetical protein
MQLVDEVIVPNTRRTCLEEGLNCVLNPILELLNKIADKEETCTIETVVTMDTNQSLISVGFGFSDSIDEFDELAHFIFGWRLLRNGRKFVVHHTPILKAFGIIHWRIVADVDYCA